MSIAQKLQAVIRNVPNFPIEGVNFKDISTIFLHPEIVSESAAALALHWENQGANKIMAIDSRGFLFAPQMACNLGIPLVLVRKKGKIPPPTIAKSYSLEYGTATIEVYANAIQAGDKIIIHDDLLATGGTALAAAELAQTLGAEVIGFSFLIGLDFLGGKEKLAKISKNIHTIVNYA